MKTHHRVRAAVLSVLMLSALAFAISLPLIAVHSTAVASVRAEDEPVEPPAVDAPPPVEESAPADAPAAEEPIDPASEEPTADEPADTASEAPVDDTADEPADDTADEPVDDAGDDAADDTAADDTADEPVDDAGDDAADEPVDEASDEVIDEVSEEGVEEIETLTGTATVYLEFGGAVGEAASGAPISVSGSGMEPSSRVELWVFSTPRLLATSSTTDAGDFEVSAEVPSGLAAGDHTVLLTGTDSEGNPVKEATGFSVDADGVITGVLAGADVTGLEVPAMPEAAMAPPYPIVAALDNPAAVVTTAIAGLAVVAVVGVGAGGAASGLNARSAGESVAGGGINEGTGVRYDEISDVDMAHNRGWRTAFTPSGSAPGDNSSLHRFPGTSFVDEASFVLTASVATKSPLLSRTFADAAPIRAMLGSLSLLLPIAAAVLGVIGAVTGDGIAMPPVLGVLTALIIIGVLDASAGLIGALAFTAVVAFSGGIIDVGSVRTLLGIGLLLVGPGMIAGTFRSIRRLPQPGAAYAWERLADFVIVPLLGGYTTYNIVTALPPLGGSLFPIADSAVFLGVVVLVALVAKIALEEISSRWFPERMATVVPLETAEPGLTQQTISGLLRVSAFVFVSAAFIGNVWQLWVAGIIFMIPLLISPLSSRFPNLPRVWRLLPEGVPYLGIMLVIYLVLTTILYAQYGDTSDYARVSFLVLLIPDFILGVLWWFGRQGADDDEVRWFLRPSMTTVYRVGGVVVLAATVWLAYRTSV